MTGIWLPDLERCALVHLLAQITDTRNICTAFEKPIDPSFINLNINSLLCNGKDQRWPYSYVIFGVGTLSNPLWQFFWGCNSDLPLPLIWHDMTLLSRHLFNPMHYFKWLTIYIDEALYCVGGLCPRIAKFSLVIDAQAPHFHKALDLSIYKVVVKPYRLPSARQER